MFVNTGISIFLHLNILKKVSKFNKFLSKEMQLEKNSYISINDNAISLRKPP